MNSNTQNSHFIRNSFAFILISTILIILMYPHIVPMPSNSVFDLDFHGKLSYIFEISILNFLFLGVLVLTQRFWFTAIIMAALYLVFIAANTVKLTILETPVFHTDFFHASELLLQWSVLKYILLWLIPFLLIIIMVLRYFWKTERPSSQISRKLKFYFLFTVFILAFFAVVKQAQIKDQLVKNNLYYSKINSLVSAADLGYLTVFFQRLILESSDMEVNQYDENKIRSIIEKYGLKKSDALSTVDKPNIIYILVEAYTNPSDFGWQTTRPAMPIFAALKKYHNSGRMFSPVVGGKSANAEFELLTGMSMRFFPTNSIPYTDQIERAVPGIVSFLNEQGYFTATLHMASLSFFNYKQVYEFMGFDEIATLWGDKTLEFNQIGNYPATKHWVEKVINTIESNEAPTFLFTFPSYPHGPWDYDVYDDSNLDVINNMDMSDGDRKQYKNYANIIYETDQAIGEIIAHFEQSNEKTIVVVLGDHQPFLKDYGSKIFKQFDSNTIDDDISRIYAHYQTPVAIWSNFQLKTKPIDHSMNFLSSLLIDEIGFENYGLMKLNAVMRDQIKVFNWIIRNPNGTYGFDEPAKYQSMIDDYRTIQYDILLGENYFERFIKE